MERRYCLMILSQWYDDILLCYDNSSLYFDDWGYLIMLCCNYTMIFHCTMQAQLQVGWEWGRDDGKIGVGVYMGGMRGGSK